MATHWYLIFCVTLTIIYGNHCKNIDSNESIPVKDMLKAKAIGQTFSETTKSKTKEKYFIEANLEQANEKRTLLEELEQLRMKRSSYRRAALKKKEKVVKVKGKGKPSVGVGKKNGTRKPLKGANNVKGKGPDQKKDKGKTSEDNEVTEKEKSEETDQATEKDKSEETDQENDQADEEADQNDEENSNEEEEEKLKENTVKNKKQLKKPRNSSKKTANSKMQNSVQARTTNFEPSAENSANIECGHLIEKRIVPLLLNFEMRNQMMLTNILKKYMKHIYKLVRDIDHRRFLI